MTYRKEELAEFSESLCWLPTSESQTAWESSQRSCSRTRYGLDETRFANIERCSAEGDAATDWLTERCVGKVIRVIYEEDAVFETMIEFFLRHWEDLFQPSRDDAIILSQDADWALLYCHEEEFEFARTD